MSKDMLGIAVRKLVTLPESVLGVVCDLLEKLSDPEWVTATKRFLRKENPWQDAPGLLRRVGTVPVSGAKKFVVAEHVQAANIGWMGDNFKRLFSESVEEDAEDATLAVHSLEKASLDVSILAELGSRAQISLLHFFNLLEKQASGEEGTLLVNGYANIAYIRDKEGVLWAVDAHWGDASRDWFVGAYSVGSSLGWLEGARFSPAILDPQALWASTLGLSETLKKGVGESILFLTSNFVK